MVKSLLRIDVHLGPSDLNRALRSEVAEGLAATPKQLSPKWFYDDLGCALFEAITRLPEYYPTRRERALLGEHAPEIAALTGAGTLIEIGSGSSDKTGLLLDALFAAGTLDRFVPFDVSESALRAAGTAVAGLYPGIQVHAVVGDFERHLHLLPRGGTRLVAFLGSTIGNIAPAERRKFLTTIAAGMEDRDSFLVGVDLVKDVGRLEAAYNDAAGVTAAFNRNILSVINRALDGNFDLMDFEHVARFDRSLEWMEMLLRARVRHRVRLAAIDMLVEFEAGEEMRTEISAKFRRDFVYSELHEAGLTPVRWWTDPAGDFALVLAGKGRAATEDLRRRGSSATPGPLSPR